MEYAKKWFHGFLLLNGFYVVHGASQYQKTTEIKTGTLGKRGFLCGP
jgi:hypothetical protein